MNINHSQKTKVDERLTGTVTSRRDRLLTTRANKVLEVSFRTRASRRSSGRITNHVLKHQQGGDERESVQHDLITDHQYINYLAHSTPFSSISAIYATITTKKKALQPDASTMYKNFKFLSSFTRAPQGWCLSNKNNHLNQLVNTHHSEQSQRNNPFKKVPHEKSISISIFTTPQ